ncbi:MAG: chloride channel protein [Candidatus Merdivicinus sp.]|jgi:H+/Cl- antiporter ClcA
MDKFYTALQERFQRMFQYFLVFLKWVGISVLCGVPIGFIGFGFHHLVEIVTEIRTEHSWILFFLPLAGVVIALLYRLAGMEKDGGTNSVLISIRTGEHLSIKMAPLIFISTVLTHFFGGSSGREGAALQLGGSIGAQFGRWLRLSKRSLHVITLCGMSAAFAALFGTPLTAAIFALEVVNVGTMFYAAIVPCILSALIGAGIAGWLGAVPTAFSITGVPALTLVSALQALVLGILCALVIILFCVAMHTASHLYQKRIPNSILRAAVGGVLVIAVTLLVGTRDYNGAGMNIITRAMAGEAVPYAFLLKILLTALTLGAGFKGGEIVPAFFVGSTFGCFAGGLLGLDPSFGAAIGLAGVFCGVVNCPLATILLCLELFDGQAMPLFAITIAVSYMLSGYFGLYSGQRFFYSKTEPMKIDRAAG